MTNETKQPARTVAIVEDDARIRLSLVEMLRRTSECECVGEYGSGEEAIAGLSSRPARVVVMDINLPGISGVETVRRLAEALPKTQFVMLTVAKDTTSIFNAFAAGAAGYLLKPVGARQLLAAIKDIDQGGAPMTSSIARQVVATFRRKGAAPAAPDATLSEREYEVLKLLAEGWLYKQAAAELGMSINTFCEHIRRIYRKLHVHSRHEAIAHYQKRF